MQTLWTIILLSQHGYWLAGSVQTVKCLPVPWDFLTVDRRELILRWELIADAKSRPMRLAGGEIAIEKGRPVDFSIRCPDVRVPLEFSLNWRVVERLGGRERYGGALPITVYPRDLGVGWAEMIGRKKLVVIDPVGRLASLLTTAHVPHVRLSDTSQLQLDKPALVLVAENALIGGTFEQLPLLALSRWGTRVMVFRQTRVKRLGLFSLVNAPRSARLEAAARLDLFAFSTPAMMDSWLADLLPQASMLRVPLTGRTLGTGIIHRPAEARGGASPVRLIVTAPINRAATVSPLRKDNSVPYQDALLASQRNGSGEIVYCQLPLGDWQTDPRSQLFLGSALEYLTVPLHDSETVNVKSDQFKGHPAANQPTLNKVKADLGARR